MTKEIEQMIKEIYEEIADKTLNFWCKIILKNYLWVKTINQEIDWIHEFEVAGAIKDRFFINDVEKNIWHPVMIGNVLGYQLPKLIDTNQIIAEKIEELEIHKWSDFWEFEEIRDIPAVIDWIEQDVFEIKLCSLWKEKTKPIEQQSEECIKFIYSLIKTNG